MNYYFGQPLINTKLGTTVLRWYIGTGNTPDTTQVLRFYDADHEFVKTYGNSAEYIPAPHMPKLPLSIFLLYCTPGWNFQSRRVFSRPADKGESL